MQKTNIKEVALDSSMLQYFEGKVEIRKMVTDALTKDIETFLVTFLDGARTKLHYHETDQVLIATEGSGIVVLQTEVRMSDDTTATIKMDEVHHLAEGDFVCVPALKWHWHGAAKGSSKFSHLQVKRPGKTIWVE
jgi:quercetin dioxygenase-like cupin family protein